MVGSGVNYLFNVVTLRRGKRDPESLQAQLGHDFPKLDFPKLVILSLLKRG